MTNASHRRTARRRRAAAVTLVAIVAAGLTTAVRASRPVESVEVVVEGRRVMEVRRLDGSGKPRAAAEVAASLPKNVRTRDGGVLTSYALDRERIAARIVDATDRQITAEGRPRATRIDAPVVAQALRNNCESAALQILLATTGLRVDQLELQAGLDRSGPPDPQGEAPDEVWGDPDEGYVGRADGTGPAGGFGVYPRPVAALASRLGRRLEDITGSSIGVLRRRLLEGHAVMVWIGLGDGPYWSWTSPSGRAIRVNLNEHTIVLVGVRRTGQFDAVNVLKGTREVLSPEKLQAAWNLLGRRALATT